jgi:hypothetical protein
MSFTLQVFDGSEIFTYLGDQLAGTPEYDEGLRDTDIEQATVQLQIINPTFLGVTTQPELPTGPYRCLLQYDYSDSKFPTIGNINVINGRILKNTVAHSRGTNIWIITIVNDALDEAQRLLETTSLISPGATSMETAVVADDGGVDVNPYNWYDLEGLFTSTLATITNLEFSFQSDNPFFSLSITYDDAGEDVVITREIPLYVTYADPSAATQLPAIDAMQLVEILQAMLGWKLSAQYGSFPSPAVTVEVFTDLNVLPVVDAFAVDGLDTEEDRFIEGSDIPEKEDFALTYENSVTADPLSTGGQNQVQNAIYASGRPSFDPAGKATNRGTTKIELFVAQIDTVDVGTIAADTPDPVEHPNYTEDVLWCRPMIAQKDSIYITGIVDVGGNNHMVRARQPNSPGTGQVGSTAEYFAIELFKNYGFSGADRLIVNGSIFFDSLAAPASRPVVGDPLSGLRLYGEHWRVISLKWTIPTLVAEVSLDRPINIPVTAITQPFICPPNNVVAQITNVDDTDVTFQIDWEAPVFGCGQQLPVEYEITVQVPLLGTQIHTVSALTFTTTYVGGGIGQYDGQIRSKAADGTFSVPVGFTVIAEDPDA